MKLKFFLPLFLFYLLSVGPQLAAQNPGDTLRISASEVLEWAGARNLQYLESKIREEAASAGEARAREWWLPEIYAGSRAHWLQGDAMNTDGAIFTNIRRNSFWSGAGFDLSWNLARGVYDPAGAEWKSKAAAMESRATRNRILLQAVELYYDLLGAQLSLAAYEQLQAENEALLDEVQARVELGLAYESDLLRYRSNLSRLGMKVLQARAAWNEKRYALQKILNLPAGTVLLAADSILPELDLLSTDTLNYSDSLFRQRPEYLAMDYSIRSLRMGQKKISRGLLLPELHINNDASYFGAFQGPADPTTQFNVALMWKLPLSALIYRGEWKDYDARIRLLENRSRQFRADVQESFWKERERLELLHEEINLGAESVQLAREALQQSLAREKLGTVRPFEVIQAQEFYIRARLDYLRALASWNKAQYRLYLATGRDL